MKYSDLRIIPSNLRYKSAPSVDQEISFSLNESSKQLIEYDKNITVSLAQVYDDERQASQKFRPTFQINYLYNNPYTGTTQYIPFRDYLYYFKAEETFNTGIWYGYPQFYEFDFLRPKVNDGHFNYNSKSAYTYNWDYYLTYPFENDYTKRLRAYVGNTLFVWTAQDGIPFEITNININGNTLISFNCLCPHGLNIAESIVITDPNFQGYNGNKIFEVFSFGNGITGSENTVFNIYDVGYTGTTFANGTRGTFKRIIFPDISGETTSKYYIRKNKVILTTEDLILTRTGFQDNPFRSEKAIFLSAITPTNKTVIAKKSNTYSYTLTTKNDLLIDGLSDNQKRPISEIFLSFVFKGYSGYFNKPYLNNIGLKEGWQFNIEETNNPYWGNLQIVSNSDIDTSSYTLTDISGNTRSFFYNNSLNKEDIINGDFCEWNDYEQTERVISPYYQKIKYNPDNFNIESTPSINQDGFYYKPHNSLQLRVYSNFLETGSADDVDNVPYYSYYSKADQEFRWRDLYEYGFIDEQNRGVNYPFLNGSHYPFAEFIFRLIPEGSTINNIINIPIKPLVDGCE